MERRNDMGMGLLCFILGMAAEALLALSIGAFDPDCELEHVEPPQDVHYYDCAACDYHRAQERPSK